MLLLLPMFGLWWTKVGGGQAFCVERGLRTCPVARPIYHISRVPPSNGWGFFGGPESFGLAGGRWACVFPTPCGGGANVSRALGTGTYHSLRAPHANVFSQNTLNMVSPFALRNNQRHIVIITNVK